MCISVSFTNILHLFCHVRETIKYVNRPVISTSWNKLPLKNLCSYFVSLWSLCMKTCLYTVNMTFTGYRNWMSVCFGICTLNCQHQICCSNKSLWSTVVQMGESIYKNRCEKMIIKYDNEIVSCSRPKNLGFITIEPLNRASALGNINTW